MSTMSFGGPKGSSSIRGSTMNLIKLALIALFVKYQLISEHKQQLVMGRPMGLIYNRDGKFIYRPPRLHHGHIIVIEDRKKSKSLPENSSNKQINLLEQQQQIPASSNSIYPQFQLISPSGQVVYRVPEPIASHGSPPTNIRLAATPGAANPFGGLYPAAAALSASQPTPLQLGISARASQPPASAFRLIPIIQFYHPPISQAVVARPSNRQDPLPPNAQIYVGGHFGAGLGYPPDSWQQATQQPMQQPREQQSFQQQQQQQPPPPQHTIDGANYDAAQKRLESMYDPQLASLRASFDTESSFGETPNPFGGPSSYSHHQASEAAFMDDMMPPAQVSSPSIRQPHQMLAHNSEDGSDILLLPYHHHHHNQRHNNGGGGSPRAGSRQNLNDLMGNSHEYGDDLAGSPIGEGPMSRDDHQTRVSAAFSVPSYKAASHGRGSPSNMDSSRNSRLSDTPPMTTRAKAQPPPPPPLHSSGDEVIGRDVSSTGGSKYSTPSQGKRNSHARAKMLSHQQQPDHGGLPNMSSASRSANSMRDSVGGDSQAGGAHLAHSSGHDDDPTNPDSRGAQYWKQYRDQFDVLH